MPSTATASRAPIRSASALGQPVDELRGGREIAGRRKRSPRDRRGSPRASSRVGVESCPLCWSKTSKRRPIHCAKRFVSSPITSRIAPPGRRATRCAAWSGARELEGDSGGEGVAGLRKARRGSGCRRRSPARPRSPRPARGPGRGTRRRRPPMPPTEARHRVRPPNASLPAQPRLLKLARNGQEQIAADRGDDRHHHDRQG